MPLLQLPMQLVRRLKMETPNDEFIEFSNSEEAYRRGYCHGFLAALRNPELTVKEVYAWRNGNEETAPPGSALAGMKMQGLRKDEEHRLFVNMLKENWSE